MSTYVAYLTEPGTGTCKALTTVSAHRPSQSGACHDQKASYRSCGVTVDLGAHFERQRVHHGQRRSIQYIAFRVVRDRRRRDVLLVSLLSCALDPRALGDHRAQRVGVADDDLRAAELYPAEPSPVG